ncbi:MAG: trigger factor [Rikenellaceae bacterium]
MNVVLENLENQGAIVKVTVSEADYKETVTKALKDYRKKANVPGFRPGMVPMGIINKMYKKGVTAEEAYKAASSSMMTYFQDNKINILGEPLPADSQPALDFDTQTEFEFHFEIGMAPEVNLDLAQVEIEKFVVSVDDKMRKGYSENYLRRFGSLVDKDTVSNEEALTVTLSNDEMDIEDAYVGLIGMSEEEKAPFIGKVVGDTMEVNVNELYKSPSQRASILSVKEEELADINPNFTLNITRIRNFETPELNEELFAQAFPDGSVKTEEQFNEVVENNLKNDLARETRFKFADDAKNAVVAAAGLTLPEPFLKKWLFAINENKFTMEEIEAEFASFVDMMSYDILKRKFVEDAKLEITQEDVKGEAKALAAAQFAQYGMANVEEDMLNNYADTILGNKEEARKIYERVGDMKIVNYIESVAKINEKTITVEEFAQMVNPAAAVPAE